MYKRVLLTMALTLACAGQSPTPRMGKQIAPTADQNATDPSEIQSEALQFKLTGPVQGAGTSPALAVPFQCTDDGSVFLDILSPANAFDHSVYSLLDGKVQKFDLNTVPNLQDMQRIAYFPGDSTVAFLVQAIKNPDVSPGGGVKTEGERKAPSRNPNKHQYFVVEFDRNGQYEQYIPLAFDTPLFRLAVLPDRELLVTGYDPANDAQQLLLLDAQGQLVRAIDQPLTESERSDRRDAVPWKRLSEGGMSAGLTTFVSYKDSVLAWRAGTNDPVLQIGAGGATREVPIALPKGTALADVVASDDQWVVHVNTSAAISGHAAIDWSSYAYYEVSPLDGSLLRRLVLPKSNVGSIACKSRGKYMAFSTDKDHKLVEFTADVQ